METSNLEADSALITEHPALEEIAPAIGTVDAINHGPWDSVLACTGPNDPARMRPA
jgi:hypothetical protein